MLCLIYILLLNINPKKYPNPYNDGLGYLLFNFVPIMLLLEFLL